MLTDFSTIAILGVAASLVIELITRIFGTDTLASRLVTLVVAVVIATGYVLLSTALWWPTFITILGVASAVYAFFLKGKSSAGEITNFRV